MNNDAQTPPQNDVDPLIWDDVNDETLRDLEKNSETPKQKFEPGEERPVIELTPKKEDASVDGSAPSEKAKKPEVVPFTPGQEELETLRTLSQPESLTPKEPEVTKPQTEEEYDTPPELDMSKEFENLVTAQEKQSLDSDEFEEISSLDEEKPQKFSARDALLNKQEHKKELTEKHDEDVIREALRKGDESKKTKEPLKPTIAKGEDSSFKKEAPVPEKPSTEEPLKNTLKKTEPISGTIPVPKAPQPELSEIEVPKAPYKESVPSEIPKPATKNPSIKSYKSDMEYAMSHAQTGTMAQVLESARMQKSIEKNRSPFSKKNASLLLLSVIFIMIGAGIFFFFTRGESLRPKAEIEVQSVAPSIIEADEHLAINVTDASAFRIHELIINAFTDNTVPEGQLVHAYFIEESPTGLRRLNAPDFFERLNIDLPTRMNQMLLNNFMFGAYMVDVDYEPFLILTIDAFEPAFEGMQAWEEEILDDLNEIFLIPTDTLTRQAYEEPFIERVIENTNIWTMLTPQETEETPTETVVIASSSSSTATTAEGTDSLEQNNPVSPVTEITQMVGLARDGETTEDEESAPDESTIIPVTPIEVATSGESEETVNTTVDISNLFETVSNTLDEPETEEPITDRTPENRFAPIMVEDVQLVYSFVNENTLVISTHPVVVNNIAEVFENKAFFE